ncbi:MAG: hypothetical protein HOK80_09370 [Candidatus Cloacimonetes bacterium]|jgi:hypothetical protein|nr:hypothetical protein [Candidatus Cloacimonadota bacterium]
MTPANIPRPQRIQYGKNKWGVYGQLGEGANVQIRFVQTAMHSNELKDITLISHIPESEKWDVRDLFQRDVDGDRVGNDIIPYLKHPDKVKFFNPLTLVLLPIQADGNICNKIECLPSISENVDGVDCDIYERQDYYKLRVQKDDQGNEEFAQLLWNEYKCYIVAIDGQHRLSALRRWHSELDGGLSSWKIPVVILVLNKVDPAKHSSTLLEVVRNTFVYINTKAERLNRDREILLNDESVNAICTQELIQFSHKNDCKPKEERDGNIMPLIFYDWRGEVNNHMCVPGPASLKGIEEIYSWFSVYILGADASATQGSELHLADLIPPLQGYGEGKTLTSGDDGDAKRIRKQFRTLVMPGVLYFLQNFKPYAEYIAACRKIEEEHLNSDDTSLHAFMKLRFGSHNALEDRSPEVNARFEEIVEELTDIKTSTFDEIISLEIGMRGVICAFAKAKKIYNSKLLKNGETASGWLDFAIKITPIFDAIYDEGWFKSFEKIEESKRRLLTHIIYDAAGSIVNYKVEHAEKALGSFLLILALNKAHRTENTIIDEDGFEEVWGEESNSLRKTVQAGHRKNIRAQLATTLVGTIHDLNAEATRQAEVQSTEQIQALKEWLENDG